MSNSCSWCRRTHQRSPSPYCRWGYLVGPFQFGLERDCLGDGHGTCNEKRHECRSGKTAAETSGKHRCVLLMVTDGRLQTIKAPKKNTDSVPHIPWSPWRTSTSQLSFILGTQTK